MSQSALVVLKEVFGYDVFRPHQEDIIDAAIAGEDVLAVMPTGGGKSLCYQVPALALGPGSLVLVVSPLIALMREQVAFLRGLGVQAALLNSTLDAGEWNANAEAAIRGELRLLYLAPETLASGRAAGLLSRARIDLFAVDEAHCISEWGHDFRPEYRTLGEIRNRLVPRRGSAASRVPCLALTATATERVREDITRQLGLKDAKLVVASFDRPNIFLEVRRRERAVDQLVELAASVPDGSGIVYCFSRSRADAMAADLSARGVSALPYHAGLPDQTRAANQDAFIRDEVRVICATTAFGMGIDKPDVRFVAHADLPKSVEQYYQEIGRAGRDGLPARTLLLFGYGDAMKIRALVAKGDGAGGDREGDEDFERQKLAAETSLRDMLRYVESPGCRRAALLAHFGEIYAGPPTALSAEAAVGAGTAAPEPGEDDPSLSRGCGACDVCAPPEGRSALEEVDATEQALKFLSCVARTGERYGAGHVVDVLLGSKNERVLGLGHSKLSTWGIGKEWPRGLWMELGGQLARRGYLDKDEDYGVLRLTEKARVAFRERPSITVALAPRAAPEARTRDRSTAGASRGAREGVSAAVPGSREARLEEALRAFRRSLAERDKVPNYMIFPDRTLYDLVAKSPADRADLLEVFGMGKVKVERFGDELLRTIAATSAVVVVVGGGGGGASSASAADGD
jgi:ATP-dependent DNA helicase RecQ